MSDGNGGAEATQTELENPTCALETKGARAVTSAFVSYRRRRCCPNLP